ncbi:MAG: pantoate--beta-alanine ligase, partial [Robiginitalea sp.]
MNGKKVLFVSSELVPYLPENTVSKMSYEAPRMVNSKGGQIRIFMPRYGNINERRHQLHEVIRLSGMNLVINDMDMPLIIKVASIPRERIQVYFIDNEEYFKRKATFTDENGELFPDNDERAILFAPDVSEMYGSDISARHYDFKGMDTVMEGAFRPGHFDGVGTIV